MTALKKTLLFMLVLCTLGYGSAWAYDGHAVDLNRDALTTATADTADMRLHFANEHNVEQHSEQTPAANVDCDHCAHISAHLLAIFPHNGYLCSINQSSELLELSETSVSFIVSPDLRPPRV